jgi:hypothetical protein
MNVRRYVALAVLLFAIGTVVYLLFLSRAQPGAAPKAGGLTTSGNSVTIAAVDQGGRYGSIILTRRGERGLRADERQEAALTGGAFTVVEVHVAYRPERATATGFGRLDWQVWVDGTLQAAGGAPDLFPTLAFRGPGLLPTQLHGNAEIDGIVAVPIPPAAVGKPVYLVYAPFIKPADGGGFDYKMVARVQVWGP